ncbi:MAG: hypothetical protein KAH48_06805 [Chlorobi bacterium]|nr:hypothetical protein [Chlorobiota bacterium]
MPEKQSILIYQNADGNIKLDVQLRDESVWGNRQQMSLLFVRDIRSRIITLNYLLFMENGLKPKTYKMNLSSVINDGAIEIKTIAPPFKAEKSRTSSILGFNQYS